MGAPQFEQAGADISGGGTTNTIPRWTGPTTLGDSGLIDDGSVIYTTARNAAFGSTSSAGYRARVLAAAGAGSAFGLRIDAGTNSTDYALRIANQATTSDYLAVRGDGNVGIGTASPGAQLHISRAGGTSNAEYIRLTNTTVATNSACGITFFQNNAAVPVNRIEGTVSAAGSYDLVSYAWNGSSTAEVMRLQGSTGNLILNTANTGATIQAAGTSQGLKLPATPGNADTQTLDAYQENTWTPTLTAFDGTAPTVTTAKYTRIGRVVYFEVVLSATGAANFGSTWGNTKVSLPFAPANTIAIPINRNAIGSCGTTSGSDILLTTYAQNAETMRITGFFSV